MHFSVTKFLPAVAGALLAAAAFSAPAEAAWTNLPVPAQYSASVSSVRLCKSPSQLPVFGSVWKVTYQVQRTNSYVNYISLSTLRYNSNGSIWLMNFTTNSGWNAGLGQLDGYGSTTADDRYVPALTFADLSSYRYPVMTASQIANC